MGSPFIPVETILKVDDNELITSAPKSPEPSCTSSNYVSIGTQCDWKVETSDDKICSLLPVTDSNGSKFDLTNPGTISFGEKSEDLPLVIRGWPNPCDTNLTSEQKFIIPSSFSQQFNIQTLPLDEKFFLQFDYKTRNKLKTKQRRLDPYYRTQERVRQRAVMRIKRQDPTFREAEREKGRYRMRLKRLDPVFRSQERERQRERMKLKRSDPDFREREREQQKTRLHAKRLDPTYKEKERAQELLRMRLKRQNESIYASAICGDKIKIDSKSNASFAVSDASVFKEVDESSTSEIRNNHVVFDGFINSKLFTINPREKIKINSKSNTSSALSDAAVFKQVESEIRNNHVVFDGFINSKLFTLKPRDTNLETFHFKKQHILNFNFYNSNKEQWPSSNEINVKNIHQFEDSEETVKIDTNDSVTDSVDVLDKNKYFLSRKNFSKEDLINQTLIDIKSETQSLTEAEKDKELIADLPAIPSYSSSSGN